MSWPPFGHIVGPALGSSRNKHELTSQAEEKASRELSSMAIIANT